MIDNIEFQTSIIDRGGYNKESVHSVTLTNNGRSYTTTYTMGYGCRKWIQTGGRHLNSYSAWAYPLANHLKPGERVSTLPNLKAVADCAPHQRAHQQTIFDAFDRLTEPETPTKNDVLSCLASSASSVRHGQTFEEWAGDFGYDTDSRSAEATYRACVETWQALTRLGVDFDELEAIEQ